MKKSILMHVILSVCAFFTLLPLWSMMVTSLSVRHDYDGFNALLPNISDLSFQNYINVWTDGNFGHYFFNSLLITVVITLANILFDSMAAYALSRREFPGRGIVMGVVLSKLMIPATVLMVPTFILIRNLNLYDTYTALILPMVAETFGIFLLRQYMLSLPFEIEEAARIEGASDWRIFFSIILPLTKPALAVVVIHSVMTSWNAYIYPLILTSSDKMRTLPLGIAFYRSSHSGIDSGHLMAGSMIAAFPIILAFLLFQRQIISGLTRGAVKG